MIKHNQDGAVSGIALSLGFTIFLLVVVLGFAAWAFSGRQDYKNNVDTKIAAAVAIADQQESSVKDNQFAQEEKLPLATYDGPEAYGSLILKYPKTWSGYVDDTSESNSLLDAYFYPGVVPSLTDMNSVFALRVQVLSQSYAQTLSTLSDLQQSGSLSIAAYSLPKVPSAVGVEATGTLPNNKTGVMVVLPLRNETLQIWTEGDQFISDFNSSVLPNLSFSP